MSKHLADHRTASNGGRLTNFLRLERNETDETWHGLRQHPREFGGQNRRLVEYMRILHEQRD